MDALSKKVDDLTDIVNRLVIKVDENTNNNIRDRQEEDITGQHLGSPWSAQRTRATAGAPGGEFDVQQEFESIEKSYSSVKLHPDLIFKVDKTGIRREDQPIRAIVSKANKYNETILKILVKEDNKTCEEKLNEIAVAANAQRLYLRSEHTSILVKGNFGERTGRVFRQIHSHSSAFSEECLEEVRTAVQLCALPQESRRQSGYGYQRGSYRGGYRGSYGG